MKKQILGMAAIAALCITACKKDDAVQPAPVVKTKSITVNFSPSSSFTFFSFRDTAVVANSDSASLKWDFGLRLTTFLVNSHASGPGDLAVLDSFDLPGLRRSDDGFGYCCAVHHLGDRNRVHGAAPCGVRKRFERRARHVELGRFPRLRRALRRLEFATAKQCRPTLL